MQLLLYLRKYCNNSIFANHSSLINKKMQAIILMADIQNSSQQDQKKLAVEFKALIQSANKYFKNELYSPLTITLGDEFQGISKTLTTAIKIIFYLEETILRKEYTMKLRYIVNTGKIETPVNHKIAYGMMGSGLTAARNHLTALKKENNRFKIFTNNPGRTSTLNQALFLYQTYIDHWKPKDFALISSFLKLIDYKKVALKHKLNPSSTWRRQKSLNISQYNSIKEIILYLI